MLPRAPAQNTQIRTIWRRFRQVQTDVHNGGYMLAQLLFQPDPSTPGRPSRVAY